MMGRNHARQGACAVVITSAALGLIHFSPWSYPVIGLIASSLVVSGSVTPDWDARGSSASRSFGPATRTVSIFVRLAARSMYTLTRSTRDPQMKGAHRLLTHTFLGNVLAGSILAALCSIKTSMGPWPAAICLGGLAGVGSFSLIRKKHKWLVTLIIGFAAYTLPGVDDRWLWVWGVAFALGNAVHCFGDSCTYHGTPYWWMLGKQGKRWANFHVLPKRLQFRTGHLGEPVMMFFTYFLSLLLIGGFIYLQIH